MSHLLKSAEPNEAASTTDELPTSSCETKMEEHSTKKPLSPEITVIVSRNADSPTDDEAEMEPDHSTQRVTIKNVSSQLGCSISDKKDLLRKKDVPAASQKPSVPQHKEPAEVVADTAPKVDIGHGVQLPAAIIDKLRKKDLRNLLLDLCNALFRKEDFAISSMCGKKGCLSDSAKPELDPTKQKAILSYAAKTLPSETKENIEKTLKTILSNKYKNAAKEIKKRNVII
ncbi:uncharacterized protein LOC116417092 [Nasonia vitripennis]|uniref:BEN domain-containing protein n=1 Tax=Nasonia vitripennis TaxID=7425 RepID=A0A7M7QBW7_NASVI|nr:uncharacterized protein LOC116417092 [Nasonia vitripennis]